MAVVAVGTGERKPKSQVTPKRFKSARTGRSYKGPHTWGTIFTRRFVVESSVWLNYGERESRSKHAMVRARRTQSPQQGNWRGRYPERVAGDPSCLEREPVWCRVVRGERQPYAPED